MLANGNRLFHGLAGENLSGYHVAAFLASGAIK